jgi:transposase
MRGTTIPQGVLFSYVQLEDRIPATHPLREIKRMADAALQEMSPELDKLYSRTGRPSIPPESLIKAVLLQILFGIRSEIQLMEQMEYNLLYRWFVDLGVDDPTWTPEVFSMNRDRLFSTKIAAAFFSSIVEQARKRHLVSSEHFSVDGTLLKAWASQKSFQPKEERKRKEGDPQDFHGEKRSNETHVSTTDPDARLLRKSAGSASELCYMGHVLMENRHGLAVDGEVTTANPRHERDAAIEMLGRRRNKKQRVTVGGDKGYDVNEFHEQCRDAKVTPHIAQRDDGRATVLDGRTTRHEGYAISGQKRKRIEEIFGWVKTSACIRQVKVRGVERVKSLFLFALSVFNMVRMKNIVMNTT